MLQTPAAVVTAFQAIPKASGIEIVSCSSGDATQQCVSVSTDGSATSWITYLLILFRMLLVMGFIFCRWCRSKT
ncbi:MAG: hypothetical protein ACKPKO_40065, partial [Candidatus Fonsibacter sp.]